MAKSSKEQEIAIKIAGKVESSFKEAIGMSESSLDKLASAAKKAASVAAAAFAAVKIGDFIGDAVSEYSDFEQSMANTSAIAGATETEYEQLEEAARAAGKATTFTAAEAADALGYMALAGWEVADSTQALTPILRLAEATQADLATTSDQVTDSMSAMGLGIEELNDYLDVVVATNNNANTTASDLMEAFIGCGGAAKAAGMDYTETSTALGILANNGIKGAEAGTALNSMLVRMTTKDKAISAMTDLGVSVYDSAGNMRDMQQILIDLNNSLDGMSDSEKNAYMAAIAGTNYYTQFGYLLEGVKEGADGTASAWDTLNEALENSDGALETMDKTVTATLQGSIARMQSAISDLKISLVEDFGPAMSQALDAAAEALPQVTERFSQMIQGLPTQEWADNLQTMVGAVFDFTGRLLDGQSITEAFTGVMNDSFGVEVPGSVQTFLDIVQSGWDFLMEVIDWIEQTAVNTLNNLKETLEEHEPQLQTIMDCLADVQAAFEDAFGIAGDVVGDVTENGLPDLIGILIDVLAAVADVVDKFAEWEGFPTTIVAIGGAIAGLKIAKMATDIYKVTAAMAALNIAKAKDKAETIYLNLLYAKDAVVKAASTAATVAQTAATTAWNVVCGIATAATTALGAAFTFLTSPIGLVVLAIAGIIAVGVLLYKNWGTIKEKASELFGALSEKFTEIKENVSGKIEELKGALSEKWENIKSTASETFENVKETAGTVMETAKGVIQEKLDNIKAAYDENGGGIQGVAAAAIEGVKGYYTAGYDFIDELTGGRLSDIKDTMESKMTDAKDAISGALDNIKQSFSDKLEAAHETVTSIVEKIKGVFDFEWKLPDLKIPHISVSGGEAPYGIAGKGSLPKFSVEWFKDGGIMTEPTAFGVDGSNVMAGGEAGAEAILPLEALWSKLDTFIRSALQSNESGAIGNAINNLTNRLSDMATGTQQTSISDLLGRVTGTSDTQQVQPALAGVPITYAPVFNITGSNLTKEDVEEAEKMSREEFASMMEEWQKENDRKRF